MEVCNIMETMKIIILVPRLVDNKKSGTLKAKITSEENIYILNCLRKGKIWGINGIFGESYMDVYDMVEDEFLKVF